MTPEEARFEQVGEAQAAWAKAREKAEFLGKDLKRRREQVERLADELAQVALQASEASAEQRAAEERLRAAIARCHSLSSQHPEVPIDDYANHPPLPAVPGMMLGLDPAVPGSDKTVAIVKDANGVMIQEIEVPRVDPPTSGSMSPGPVEDLDELDDGQPF